MIKHLHIFACEYFRQELETLLQEAAFRHVRCDFFPADCDHPCQNRQMLELSKDLGDTPCILLGGGCLSQLKNQPCQIHALEQCFELLAGTQQVQAYIAAGAHLFSPGMLAQWDHFCTHSGFTAATARDFFADSTQKLVLLDTGVDETAAQRLADLSKDLGLAAERIVVGLDYLRLSVQHLLSKQQQMAVQEKDRQLADYAMVNDLVSRITSLTEEKHVIAQVLELFSMFCAPQVVAYLPQKNDEAGEMVLSASTTNRQKLQQDLLALRGTYQLNAEAQGFYIKIERCGQVLGAVAVLDIAFPQYQQHYLNLGLSVAPVVALAVSNARTYQQHLEAEAQVQQLNEVLQERLISVNALNKELEAFTYSVSHDLRAPLRSLDGFSNMLLRDYIDKLDNRGEHLLTRLRANAQHMGQLIDDLLRLSRLTRTEPNKSTCNLSDIVSELAADLQQTDATRQVDFEIQPQTTTVCDAALLKIVLENLVGNAWKYTSKKNHPNIAFGSMQQNEETIFFLRDDGDGFDMAYADKLFSPFQRLHSEVDFPGTGIGLATVQRIILRHGGRIWAEATPGKGASFFFTL